jgi:predicted metal-binding protein
MTGMQESPKSQSRPTPWRTVLLLCRKCGKKQKGGFGLKQKEPLRDELRQALRGVGRRRDVRIMEIGCLGICPKRGVTALNATRPETLHVIPAGTEASAALDTLLGRLDPVAQERVVETP